MSNVMIVMAEVVAISIVAKLNKLSFILANSEQLLLFNMKHKLS